MKSGVPQGSAVALIMCLVYVNDITEGISSYISLLPDDAKLLRKIKKNILLRVTEYNRRKNWTNIDTVTTTRL